MSQDALSETLEETLAAFEEPGVPRTTPEVADDLDLGRRTAYARLNRLTERGRIRTKKVGANARVWWRPPEPPTPPADGSRMVDSAQTDSARVDRPRIDASVVDAVLEDDVGVVVLDATCDVAWVNDAAERYFGVDREAVLGRPRAALVDAVQAPDGDGGGEGTEWYVPGDDGREERWVERRSDSIESGEFAGGRVERFYDVTERPREGAGGRPEWKEFESLVDAVDEYAIFTLDEDGHVRTWNPGAERIKGYEADEMIGEHFSQFYTDEDRAVDVPEQNLAAARQNGSVEDEGWRVRADGSRFWANVTITAIRDDDGDVRGYAKVTRDMTERREYERRLEEEKAFVESLLDNQRDVVYAFDADREFLRWNDRLREISGYTDAEIAEMGPVDFFADEDAERIASAIDRVFAGESVTIEAPFLTVDGETVPYEFTATPLTEDDGTVVGLTGVGRDVSERKAKERRLQRRRAELKRELDDVFKRVDDAFFALDENWKFVDVNDEAGRVLGQDPNTLVGQNVWEVFPNAAESTFEDEYRRALETQESVTFEEYFDPLSTWFEVNAYPSETGLSVYFRDVTERKRRERELERYERIVETVDEGIYVVDSNGEFTFVNGAYESMTGYAAAELVGSHVSSVVDEETTALASDIHEELRRGERTEATIERVLETPDGEQWIGEATFSMMDTDDGYERIGAVRDVTERIERERELEKSRRRYRTLVEHFPNGAVALVDRDMRYVTFGGHLEGGEDVPNEELEGGAVRDVLPSAVAEVVVPRYEAALDGEPSQFESTIDGTVYQFHFRPVRDDDGDIFAVLGMSQDVTEEREREATLDRQRQQLAALNNLNETVQQITEAAIEQSTRSEIERVVCERLAATDSYEFAWIAEVQTATGSVVPRVEAGVDGYGDDAPMTIDAEDPAGRGPAGEAVRTQEIQVADVYDDPEFEPWREYAEEYGYRSVAAIPIAHEGALYGLLGVYADREHAFDGEERPVLEQLGEIVGHAIAATERKQALIGDELVELEFQISDVFTVLDLGGDREGRITIDHLVPADDDVFLAFGTATPGAVETVEGLADVFPHWDDVSVGEDGDPLPFEARLTEPPVLSEVASLGGSVEEAVIEDGDYRMTIRLAPSVDVRTVIETVESQYPSATMLRQSQIERPGDRGQLHGRVLSKLTERQRATLEAAYYAGFFAWPRDATGEDVAASIGVAPPTFHQHLRKGERKVFESLFEADE